jgi:hypothetical protein
MPCTERISSNCNAGHTQSWKCIDGRPMICSKCEHEARLAKEKQEQEVEAQKRREIEQQEQLAYLDAVNAQIANIKRAKQEGLQAIKQKENGLTALIASSAEPTVPAPQSPHAAGKVLLGDVGAYQ